MKKRLKINGIIIITAALVFALCPRMFLRGENAGIPEEVLEIIGVSLILLGQLFRVSARGYKAEHSKEGGALIQGGPYSFVRNPMYLGILLIGLGIVLILFKWWVTFVFLAVFAIRYISLIFREEKKLTGIFPDSYRDYCKKVPRRILPSAYALARRDMGEYLPLKLSWFNKEIGSILTALFLTLLIESWEDIKSKGVSAYLKEAQWIVAVIILFACLVFYLSLRTAGPKKNGSDKSKSS